MATLFTRIIDGELPGTFVWKDERCVAFLTIEPINEGHALVVPREEIDHWLDCPPGLRNHLFDVAARIGRAQQTVWRPVKVAEMTVGLEVPHLHIHVFPIWEIADVDFRRARPTTPEAMAETAGRILSALDAAGDEHGVT